MVMTDCVSNFPAKVLNAFAAVSFFGWTPFGKAERLTKVLLDPESSNTLRSLRLRINPMVSVMQIVAGHLFLSNVSDGLLLLLVSSANDCSWTGNLSLIDAIGLDGFKRLTLTLSLLRLLLRPLVRQRLPNLEPKPKLSALTATVGHLVRRPLRFLRRSFSMLR